MSDRRTSFVERVLDGHARIDQLEAEVEAWAAGPQRRPLHEVLGLGPAELELVASTPDALRYVLHARRFGRELHPDELMGQRRVHDYSIRLAATVVDPFDLAELDAWRTRLASQRDAAATAAAAAPPAAARTQEPSHA